MIKIDPSKFKIVYAIWEEASENPHDYRGTGYRFFIVKEDTPTTFYETNIMTTELNKDWIIGDIEIKKDAD